MKPLWAYITSAGRMGVCCDEQTIELYRPIYTGRYVTADDQSWIMRGFAPRWALIGCQVRRMMRNSDEARDIA